MSDDDRIQAEYERDLAVCTQEWVDDIIALQGQSHGVCRIADDDWDMHLRENTGGGLSARDLTWSPGLWNDMEAYLKNTRTAKRARLDMESEEGGVEIEW
jgi:hypothetical protein